MTGGTSGPMRIAAEGALWGAIQARRRLTDSVILGDDASVQCRPACLVPGSRRAVDPQAGCLHRPPAAGKGTHPSPALVALRRSEGYRQKPNKRPRGQLARRFDALFTTKTARVGLDRLLARPHANRHELLVVLDRPEVPLNTNGSENDIRDMVTRRKLSGGTRSMNGGRARDTFLAPIEDPSQARAFVLHYLGDHLLVPGAPSVPALPDLVRQRQIEMTWSPGHLPRLPSSSLVAQEQFFVRAEGAR